MVLSLALIATACGFTTTSLSDAQSENPDGQAQPAGSDAGAEPVETDGGQPAEPAAGGQSGASGGGSGADPNALEQPSAQGEQKSRTLPTCADPSTCLHPQIDEAIWSTPVLSIRFLLDADGDGIIDQETTNYSGSVDELRNRIDGLENRNAWWSTEATRYHGYADAAAPPSMGVEIIGEIEQNTAPPLGVLAPNSTDVFFPAYDLVLAGAGICDWVDNLGVREVWMYTHHHGNLVPATSKLSSASGDISNSFRGDDMPRCANPYTLYNFNFTRGLDVMLLNRGLQIESLLRHRDAGLFVDEFVGGEAPFSSPARCGNSVWAPNSTDAFVTWEPEVVTSDCQTWTPDGGTPAEISCSTWFTPAYGDPECFPDGGVAFSVWWMQNLPGHENGLSDGDRALTNWWEPLARLEQIETADSWLTR